MAAQRVLVMSASLRRVLLPRVQHRLLLLAGQMVEALGSAVVASGAGRRGSPEL
jgi:hypothetical protein